MFYPYNDLMLEQSLRDLRAEYQHEAEINHLLKAMRPQRSNDWAQRLGASVRGLNRALASVRQAKPALER